MIRAIVLDVDDTLCLTEEACFELENRVLASLGRAPMPRSVHIATWGQPLLEAIARRSPGINVEAFAAHFATTYLQACEEEIVDVIPNENLETLDRLAARDRRIMVLTSRTIDEVGHLLDRDHGLGARIEAAFHASNTRFRKPDPRVFDELLAHAGLPPHECVYVGDSRGDAVAAKGAGLWFIACMESGLRTHQEFAGLEVDGFICRFTDLETALATLEAVKPV